MSVYLDHAASSPMRGDIITVFSELGALVGNPASLHRPGQRARGVLEEAREELAAAVGAHPTEVIFTSGGSEADSIAVLGGWARRRDDGRARCLVTAVEHPAVLGAVEWGAEAIPVTADGVADVAAAAEAIDEHVGLVSVMAVNNETGIVQPVDRIRELAARVGAWTHSDAVQALGHLPVDFAASGLDMMSLSAHKIGGPVGVGALLARREVVPRATGLGGGQERQV
ncbi:cysteine desulfurase family protein, partial [Tessaracoccus lubricantis]